MLTPSDVRDELAFGPEALGMADAEFKELLGGDENDDTDDGLIGRETERVTDEIDVVLGTETTTASLARPTHVDEYDLPLPERPIQSVESVSLDTERVSGDDVDVETDVIVEETHLELAPGADRRRWPTDRRSITVEWTHGYPEGDIPTPIRGAIIGLVRSTLQEMEADGIENESVDGDSVSYEPREDVVARHLGRAKEFDAPSYYGGAQVI